MSKSNSRKAILEKQTEDGENMSKPREENFTRRKKSKTIFLTQPCTTMNCAKHTSCFDCFDLGTIQFRWEGQ